MFGIANNSCLYLRTGHVAIPNKSRLVKKKRMSSPLFRLPHNGSSLVAHDEQILLDQGLYGFRQDCAVQPGLLDDLFVAQPVFCLSVSRFPVFPAIRLSDHDQKHAQFRVRKCRHMLKEDVRYRRSVFQLHPANIGRVPGERYECILAGAKSGSCCKLLFAYTVKAWTSSLPSKRK